MRTTVEMKPEHRSALLALATRRGEEGFPLYSGRLSRNIWRIKRRVRGGEKAKEEHYRRLSYAQQNFREQEIEGEKTDRGRMYIVYGPPDEIDASYADGSPSVSWHYRSLNQTIKFRDEGRKGRYVSVSVTRN